MSDNKKTDTVDMSNIQPITVKEDRFKINHYEFMKDHPFDDMVTTSAPYYHFQVLKPENEEQREKTLKYFNEQKKLYVAWVMCPHILLYLGATEDIYIKSRMCANVDGDELNKVYAEAGHWYRFYGYKVDKQ